MNCRPRHWFVWLKEISPYSRTSNLFVAPMPTIFLRLQLVPPFKVRANEYIELGEFLLEKAKRRLRLRDRPPKPHRLEDTRIWVGQTIGSPRPKRSSAMRWPSHQLLSLASVLSACSSPQTSSVSNKGRTIAPPDKLERGAAFLLARGSAANRVLTYKSRLA